MKNENLHMKHSILELTEHCLMLYFFKELKGQAAQILSPNCDFLVGSKCCTKVSEKGLRATKPPQAWVTRVFLASAAVVFISKSCAFTQEKWFQTQYFWLQKCSGLGVWLSLCHWAWRTSRASREGTEQAPGTVSQENSRLLMELNIWNYGPDSPLGPVGITPLLGAGCYRGGWDSWLSVLTFPGTAAQGSCRACFYLCVSVGADDKAEWWSCLVSGSLNQQSGL